MAGGIAGKLTDKACKAFAAQKASRKKLADGGGLYLFITPAGGAVWRIKYRILGKEKTYSIGPTNTKVTRNHWKPSQPSLFGGLAVFISSSEMV